MNKILSNKALEAEEGRYCAIEHLKREKYHSMTAIHYHRYYEIYVLVGGWRNTYLSDKVVELKPGDVLITKPLDIHRAVGDPEAPYERYAVSLTDKYVKSFLKKNPNFKDVLCTNWFRLSKEALAQVIDILDGITKEYENQTDLSNIVVKNAIEKMLIIFYKAKQKEFDKITVKKMDIRLQEVFEYIDKNFDKDITVNDCIKLTLMSKSNFTRIFNDVVGVNLRSYVNTKRINAACKLLTETDKTVKEISETVGFENASYFSGVFKGMVGQTPKEYRDTSR